MHAGSGIKEDSRPGHLPNLQQQQKSVRAGSSTLSDPHYSKDCARVQQRQYADAWPLACLLLLLPEHSQYTYTKQQHQLLNPTITRCSARHGWQSHQGDLAPELSPESSAHAPTVAVRWHHAPAHPAAQHNVVKGVSKACRPFACSGQQLPADNATCNDLLDQLHVDKALRRIMCWRRHLHSLHIRIRCVLHPSCSSILPLPVPGAALPGPSACVPPPGGWAHSLPHR